MVTAEKPRTKTPRETWDNWFPNPDPRFPDDKEGTIDELLASLEANKLSIPVRGQRSNVTADNIRYWQKAGVLPAPVKRWHEGATRAMYPIFRATVIIGELLELQKLGYTLQQIAVRLRAYATVMLQEEDPVGIREMITDAARAYADVTKRPVTTVEVRFIDADGRDARYHYDVTPVGSEDT